MKAQMLAIMPGGTYLRRKVDVTSEGLENVRERHFYSNAENALFPVTKPHRVESYEELLAAPPIPPTFLAPTMMIIGEHNNIYPYSTKIIQSFDDIEIRQRRRQEWQDVGRQKAELSSIKSALGHPLLTTFAVIAAATMVLMVSIIALALILYRLGEDDVSAPSAILTLMLLGVIAPPKPAKVKKLGAGIKRWWHTPMKRAAKIVPAWSVYMYDTIDGEIKHYGLPVSDVALISRSAWHFPELRMWRWYGALGLPLLVVLPALALTISQTSEYTVLAVLLAIPSVLVLALLGFWKGQWFAAFIDPFNRPFCLLYRAVVSDEEETPLISLEPIRYTNMTGVDPLIYDAMVSDLLQEQMERMQELSKKTGVDPADMPMPEYQAIVNRATDAWEDIHGTLEKEDTYIPMSTSQKLQLGSIVTIAIASVAMAFLVVIATTGA